MVPHLEVLLCWPFKIKAHIVIFFCINHQNKCTLESTYSPQSAAVPQRTLYIILATYFHTLLHQSFWHSYREQWVIFMWHLSIWLTLDVLQGEVQINFSPFCSFVFTHDLKQLWNPDWFWLVIHFDPKHLRWCAPVTTLRQNQTDTVHCRPWRGLMRRRKLWLKLVGEIWVASLSNVKKQAWRKSEGVILQIWRIEKSLLFFTLLLEGHFGNITSNVIPISLNTGQVSFSGEHRITWITTWG